MCFVAGERRVQILPENIDFVLQVDEEDVSIAAGSP